MGKLIVKFDEEAIEKAANAKHCPFQKEEECPTEKCALYIPDQANPKSGICSLNKIAIDIGELVDLLKQNPIKQ